MTKAQLEAELSRTRTALTNACRILSGEETIPDDRMRYTERALRTYYLSQSFLQGLVAADGSDIEFRCTCEGCAAEKE